MSHILVTTLGDSPIVVTSMFRLLTKQEHLTIDKVIILQPQGDNRELGSMLIDEVLKGQCVVEPQELLFEDAYTESDCFVFLAKLFTTLHECKGDTVYLSLAGGRKNMSALMALVAPFYQCVKGLYHVIDKSEHTDRKNFIPLSELARLFESNNREQLQEVMSPDLDDLRLVPIPLENALRVPPSYLQKILSITSEQLQEKWTDDPDEAEAQQFMLEIVKPNVVEPILHIYFTEQAKEEYEHIAKYEANLAGHFRSCFKNMRFVNNLKAKKHGKLPDLKKQKTYPCYVYKMGDTAERPFFHTEPGDIANYPQNPVDTVIIERLAKHRTQELYEPSVEKLMETKYSKGDRPYTLEEVLNIDKPIPSVLIVPMGIQPMVATQLYVLLTSRERRLIQEVILLYPEDADKVFNGVQIAMEAFGHEDILCKERPVQGLADVASRQDCECYQKALEDTIIGLQETYLQQNPDWRIDLALSGGRKGMAALALFAAQRTRLHAIYHTLIANKALDQRIEFEMEAKEFNRLKPGEKNDKLFLRAYKTHEADFQLFKVPIGPLHGK